MLSQLACSQAKQCLYNAGWCEQFLNKAGRACTVNTGLVRGINRHARHSWLQQQHETSMQQKCIVLVCALMQMLDADDAVLEQAMQTGAALKKARDNQKAARKPKVSTVQSY